MKKVLLFLIYNFFKLLVKVSFRIFYEKTVILHRPRLRKYKPTILVSNHPSTLTDPLNAAHPSIRLVHFLANASLFKGAFAKWFFSTFYCIPVERPEDVKGRKISNVDAFAKANRFLLNGGCLYIAPEGYSQRERRLGKIKTGTARIALSTADKAGFRTGLTIQPVGLNYTTHTEFRSKVLIYAGEPLEVDDYQSAYRSDPREAVLQLTADLTERMRSLIIDTEDEAEDQLLRRLEELLANTRPVSLEEQFFRNKKILEQLRLYRDNFPSEDRAFRQKIQQYFDELKKNELDDRPLAIAQSGNAQPMWVQALILLLGLPIFLYGWINNWLAHYLPWLLSRKIKMYIGYTSTIKILGGILVYPVVYGLQIWLVSSWLAWPGVGWAYALTLLPMGWLAWEYRKHYRRFVAQRKWMQWQRKDPESGQRLLVSRKEIVGELLERVFAATKLIA